MPGWILRSEAADAIEAMVLRLPTGAVKTLGRTARADFIVQAPLVSRLHCRLTADASNQLVVEDLGSQNGTRVNGRKVDRATLKVGDRLTVGRVEFHVAQT
ncbi:MAG TPA: FHA domain-containing protein [Vicinamibacterales bacterium]